MDWLPEVEKALVCSGDVSFSVWKVGGLLVFLAV